MKQEIKQDVGLSMGDFLKLYLDRRMLIVLVLGFCGGLPYLLYSSTLAYWMSQEGIDLKTIGLFGLASLPAAFKFLWAPLMDRLSIPYLTNLLGQRRAWLLVSQLMSTLALFAMSSCDPRLRNLELLALYSVILATGAASQNIMILTYQVERLGKTQYGAAEAVCVFGYRMGLLLAGAGALYLSVSWTWHDIYQFMAWVSLIGIGTVLLIKEPAMQKDEKTLALEKLPFDTAELSPLLRYGLAIATWIHGAVICPFKTFMHHKGWALSLMIMLFYKVGDNLIGSMANIFYKDMGYSPADIANASKIFAMWASVLGGILGGYLISRLSIYKALFIFGLSHALSLFLYVLVALSPEPNLSLLYLVSGVEHLTGGMSLTALFSYQMMLANRHYATTQLALLTSFANMGRSVFAVPSGYLVEAMSWAGFFTFAAGASLVILPLIMWLGCHKGAWHQKA